MRDKFNQFFIFHIFHGFNCLIVWNNNKQIFKALKFYTRYEFNKSCSPILICRYSVRDFDEKTRQKEMQKTPKKRMIFASNHSFYSMFHNESGADRTFQKVPTVKFLKKNNKQKNGLSNYCTKNQVIPMISFVNIKDFKLKTKILSVVVK